MAASRIVSESRSTGLAPTLALTLAMAAAGCSAPEAPPTVSVVDSAGVRVVTNLTLDVPTWSLGPEPVLALGTVDEEGPEQFYAVSAARRLAGGRLVIANGGTRELRYFSLDGKHLASVGGEGQGPGEFGFPGPLWTLAGDSLAVWDGRLRRLSVFSPEGTFSRTASLGDAVANPDILAVVPDGRILVAAEVFDFSQGESFRVMPMHFLLFGPDGALLDSLPSQRLAEYGALGESGMIGTPLFAPRTEAAADTGGYWVGTQESEEVLRYTVTGDLAMKVRWPGEDRRTSAADADVLLQEDLARSEEARHPRIRQLHAARPRKDVFPSHGRLRTTTHGWLWMEAYRRPGQQGPDTWRIFDADGVLRGRIHLPERTRILEIGEDYLVGVWRDEFDVEHVRMYGVTRTEPPEEG